MEKTIKRQPLQQRLPAFLSNAYAILLPVLLCLSVDSTGYLGITEVKFAVFYWSSGIYLTLLAAFGIFVLVRSLIRRQRPGRLPRLTVMQVATLCYLAFTALSAALSSYGAKAWTGYGRLGGAMEIIVCCICLVCVSFFAEPKQWMVYLLGGAMLFFGIVCVLQTAGGNPLGLYPGEDRFGTTESAAKFLGTTGSITLGAAFLCLTIPILTICALRMKQRARFVLLLPAALALFVLFKMHVQAGIVGLAAGLLATVIILLPKRRQRLILFQSLVVAAAVAVIVLIFFDFNNLTLHELHEVVNGRAMDAYGTKRIYIWRNVIKLLPDHWLFGSGPDTLRFDGVPWFIVTDAHNVFLNILYNQGIFSLLSYLVMLGAAFVGWSRNGRTKPAAAALGAAAACYTVQGLFGINAIVTTPCFMTCLGLLDASCREKD